MNDVTAVCKTLRLNSELCMLWLSLSPSVPVMDLILLSLNWQAGTGTIANFSSSGVLFSDVLLGRGEYFPISWNWDYGTS